MSLGAGILFSNQTHVLLGKKAYGKLRGKWSGFGGTQEPGETAVYGAIREILEEIYGIYNHPHLVAHVADIIPLRVRSRAMKYTLYQSTFKDLNTISRAIRAAGVYAPYYPTGIPLSIVELARNFQAGHDSEFTALAIFRIAQLRSRDVDKYVFRDLKL